MEDEKTFENKVKEIIRKELDQMNGGDRLLFNRDLDIGNGKNFRLSTIKGTKIGTKASEKIGFYGTTPVIQQDNSVTGASFSEESGTAVNAGSTFGGYTIGEIVTILQNLGLIA